MRHPKKSRVSIIDTIPRELVTEILCRVAASSVGDISRIKLSCKELRDVAEDTEVYRRASLDKIPIVEWIPLTENQRNFLNKCRNSDNPELWYREALFDFFNKSKPDSALENLVKASRFGHVGATYVACIVLLFSGDDKLKGEGIKLIGKIKNSEKRKMRLYRAKLLKELEKMWVKNPVLREPPVFCSTHGGGRRRQRNEWSSEEEEEDGCEACGAEREARLISSSFNYY